MALGSNHMTVTTHANFIPEIWSKTIKKALEQNLVFAKKVMRFDSDVAKYGDTIHIPSASLFSATAKSANTELTPQVTTEGKTDISINKHYAVPFVIEDITAAQSQYNIASTYQAFAGYALQEQIDTDLATLVSTAFSNSTGAADRDMGDEDILKAIIQMDNDKISQADRCLIVKPAQYAALMRIAKFVDAQSIPYDKSDSPLRTYLLGQIYGNPVYKSTNVYTSGNAAYNVLLQKEAMALAMQKNVSIEKERRATFLADVYVASTIYGVGAYRTEAAIPILSQVA